MYIYEDESVHSGLHEVMAVIFPSDQSLALKADKRGIARELSEKQIYTANGFQLQPEIIDELDLKFPYELKSTLKSN